MKKIYLNGETMRNIETRIVDTAEDIEEINTYISKEFYYDYMYSEATDDAEL